MSIVSRYNSARLSMDALHAYAAARIDATPYNDAFHRRWASLLWGEKRLPLRYFSNREVVVPGACKGKAPRVVRKDQQ